MAKILSLPDTRRETAPEPFGSGEVVYLDVARPSHAIARLHRTLAHLGDATPTALGWAVIGRGPDGEESSWFLASRRAYLGYLEQWPEVVFLDHGDVCQIFACSPAELAVRFELGLLPTPLDEVR